MQGATARGARGVSMAPSSLSRDDRDRAAFESHFGIRRIIVGMTGATGAVLGVELLRQLRQFRDVETHLILSRWARATIQLETGVLASDVTRLADVVYSWDDQGAAISSGSFSTLGMAVIPCSMKTLAGIRTGYAEGLIARAADVTIKERRRLVLVPRETPLSEIHLENMLALARMGVSIVPPVPAFYNQPATISDIVDHIVARVLDQFGIESTAAKRWNGMSAKKSSHLKVERT
jgi:flavin prenyltransferase